MNTLSEEIDVYQLVPTVPLCIRLLCALAFEVLSDPVKRLAFDCVDPTIDDTVPSAKEPESKSHFFQTFAPVFQTNSRYVHTLYPSHSTLVFAHLLSSISSIHYTCLLPFADGQLSSPSRSCATKMQTTTKSSSSMNSGTISIPGESSRILMKKRKRKANGIFPSKIVDAQ